MHAPNLRYFAFVSKFVDAVTNSALDQAFEQALAARRMARAARREPLVTLPAVARAA